MGGHPGDRSDELVRNLSAVLSAGVTTFVCLQQEVRTNETFATNFC